MRRDWSQPPACWDWEVPRLAIASTPTLGDARERDVVGGLPAVLRFVQFHQDRCAVCGRTLNLVVDHDHWSGLVRGLLCEGCNTAEGRFVTTGVPALAGYRRRHPAAILGYYEPYRSADRCAAFAHAHDRTARAWRITFRRLDGEISRLVGRVAPEPHTRRWGRVTRKIESMWSEVSLAGYVGITGRFVALDDMLFLASSVAAEFDPEAGQAIARTAREVSRILG